VLGLIPALRSHCSEIARRHSIEVTFTSEGDLTSVSPDVAICFFRIAQESLRNGIVHGDAARFSVSLSRSGDDLVMTVTDNGRGFDLDEVHRRGSAFGLVSMEERARVVGANVHISTGIRLGTTIRVSGPVVVPTPTAVPKVVAHHDATTVERPAGSTDVKWPPPVPAASSGD